MSTFALRKTRHAGLNRLPATQSARAGRGLQTCGHRAGRRARHDLAGTDDLALQEQAELVAHSEVSLAGGYERSRGPYKELIQQRPSEPADVAMKIFISWSGEDSQQIAEILKDFIQSVIQESEVWISSQNITKGDKWLPNLSERLSEIDFGVSVVTKTNLSAPWLLFEVGALSKSVTSRVIPILCDNIKPLELTNSPLSQFQYADLSSEEMLKVLKAINSASSNPLDQTRLERAFNVWWPSFSDKVKNIEYMEPDVPNAAVSEESRLTTIESALVFMMKTLQKIDRRTQVYDRKTQESTLLTELREAFNPSPSKKQQLLDIFKAEGLTSSYKSPSSKTDDCEESK